MATLDYDDAVRGLLTLRGLVDEMLNKCGRQDFVKPPETLRDQLLGAGKKKKKKARKVLEAADCKYLPFENTVLTYFEKGVPGAQMIPYFSLREIDQKLLRPALDAPQTNEQLARAKVSQLIVKEHIETVAASKPEIRLLKNLGILGKRAPKCSLMSQISICKLLLALGFNELARKFNAAWSMHSGDAEFVQASIPAPRDSTFESHSLKRPMEHPFLETQGSKRMCYSPQEIPVVPAVASPSQMPAEWNSDLLLEVDTTDFQLPCLLSPTGTSSHQSDDFGEYFLTSPLADSWRLSSPMAAF